MSVHMLPAAGEQGREGYLRGALMHGPSGCPNSGSWTHHSPPSRRPAVHAAPHAAELLLHQPAEQDEEEQKQRRKEELRIEPCDRR